MLLRHNLIPSLLSAGMGHRQIDGEAASAETTRPFVCGLSSIKLQAVSGAAEMVNTIVTLSRVPGLQIMESFHKRPKHGCLQAQSPGSSSSHNYGNDLASPTFALESPEMLRRILSLVAALLCTGSIVAYAQSQGGTVTPLTTDCSSPASAFLPECAGLTASPYAPSQPYNNGTTGQTSSGQGMYGGAMRCNPFPRLQEMVPRNEFLPTSTRFRLGIHSRVSTTPIWACSPNNLSQNFSALWPVQLEPCCPFLEPICFQILRPD